MRGTGSKNLKKKKNFYERKRGDAKLNPYFIRNFYKRIVVLKDIRIKFCENVKELIILKNYR